MRNDCLLVFVAPTAVESELIEAIATCSEADGFTVSAAEGYARRTGFHDEAESVHGRGARVRVEIALPQPYAVKVVARVRERIPDRSIAYWILPLLEFGHCKA